MQWSADVTAGDWIRERLDDPWTATIHDVVPRGFEAYARVFHRATRSRPVDDAWPPLPYEKHERQWDAFGRRRPEIDTEHVRWADVAGAFGTTMHPLAQWAALVRLLGDGHPGGWQQSQAGDGWQYDAPMEGELDADAVSVVAAHLMGATTTPEAGWIGLWGGYGGLLGHHGPTPSRAFLTFASGDDVSLPAAPRDAAEGALHDRHTDMLRESLHDPLNDAFRRRMWQEGILSREISEGPRLELPGREYVLFRGGVVALADPEWFLHVPWRDRRAEEHGFAPSAHSPNLAWPDDRAWVLVSEIDWDSTIVGGSRALVDAICADERLEAALIPADARLTYDADEVNR